MRLIDADELDRKFNEMVELYENGGLYGDLSWNDAMSIYDDAPTIDPVQHGWWVEQKNNDWKYSKEYRCSECGKYRLVTTPAGMEWKYCPNCGADMRERKEE